MALSFINKLNLLVSSFNLTTEFKNSLLEYQNQLKDFRPTKIVNGTPEGRHFSSSSGNPVKIYNLGLPSSPILNLQWYKITNTDGTIKHYYHGKLENRQYNKIWNNYEKYKYNPIIHTIKNNDGIITLSQNNKELLNEINKMFYKRNEDNNGKKIINIISQPRSGTSHFINIIKQNFTALNNYNENDTILNNNEIISGPNQEIKIDKNYDKNVLMNKISTIDVKMKHPYYFYNKVLKIQNEDIIVNKIFARHLYRIINNKNDILRIINKSSLIIFLYRNYLDLYISYKKAKQTDIYVNFDTTNKKMVFDISDYKLEKKITIQWYILIKELLLKENIKYIEINYDFFHSLTFEEKHEYIKTHIEKKIDVKFNYTLKPAFHKKQDLAIHYEDKIENYEEVRHFVEQELNTPQHYFQHHLQEVVTQSTTNKENEKDKVIFIVNPYNFHYEIIESIIEQYHIICKIEKSPHHKIYLHIVKNDSFENYIKSKYRDIIVVIFPEEIRDNIEHPHIKIPHLYDTFLYPIKYDYYINCTTNTNKQLQEYYPNINLNNIYKQSQNHHYIYHQYEDDNNIYLTPFAKKPKMVIDVSLLPFSMEKPKQAKEPSKQPIFIIQGRINPLTRNYNLLEKILEIKNHIRKFTIKIVGTKFAIMPQIKEPICNKNEKEVRPQTKLNNFYLPFIDNPNINLIIEDDEDDIDTYLPPHIINKINNPDPNNKITLHYSIDYDFQDYHKEFLTAYGIISLITKTSHPMYYNRQLTSTISYAKGYKLQAIIDKDLQQIYGLKNAVVFNDANDIQNAIIKSLENYNIQHNTMITQYHI
jgi:hypothetical protein